MYRSKVERCQPVVEQFLKQVRMDIENLPGLETYRGLLSLRVWIIPPWLFRVHATSSPLLVPTLAMIDTHLRWPKLIKLAQLSGPLGVSSGVRWTMGCGFLGELIATPSNPWGKFVHASAWTSQIEGLNRRDMVREVRPDAHLGLKPKEIRKVKRLYGSAVGVPLLSQDRKSAYGCMTLETPAGVELSVEAMQQIGLQLGASRKRLSVIIRDGFA